MHASKIRRLLSLPLAIFIITMVTACGGGGNNNPKTEPADNGGGASTIPDGAIRLHYARADKQYSDWGIYSWAGTTYGGMDWAMPSIAMTGVDAFGSYFDLPLADAATEVNFLIRKGAGGAAVKDGGDKKAVVSLGKEFWFRENDDKTYLAAADVPSVDIVGDIVKAKAHWVKKDTILWNIDLPAGGHVLLHYAPRGGLTLDKLGVNGGTIVTLETNDSTPDTSITDKFPQLGSMKVFNVSAANLDSVASMLTGQIAVSALDSNGKLIDATSLQIPGVLDDMYAFSGNLGLNFVNGAPSFALWAPTAKNVNLLVYDTANAATPTEFAMTNANGVWAYDGDVTLMGKYYQYEVEVYAPSIQAVIKNRVTDPYSVTLSTNGKRSAIIDINAANLKPAQWDNLTKPALAAPEDIVLYELHIRDFSVNDLSVEAGDRGKYTAFGSNNSQSNGMKHLKELAQAGLTHVHLLPTFDFASVNEDITQRIEPDQSILETGSKAGDTQLAELDAHKGTDSFNWGYDPLHYGAPEGSYATDPEGEARVKEFREMVEGLNDAGLRVVMDVVYNHTNSSGQAEHSVLDKIVPGYYQRLNDDGAIANSSCCSNTATEHVMMEKLMIDTLIRWAKEYKVDGFRFDLMGHHMKANIEHARDALQALTLANDGVDGSKIYLYGEGWDFGEVQNNARGYNASQKNMAGTGVGTFSDRLRDAVRGGGPFDGGVDIVKNQGFINGLSYDDNETATASIMASTTPSVINAARRATLLHDADLIKVGLTGNLASYEFTDSKGALITGAALDYNGAPGAGYTDDPQEVITYVDAHDNQTLFDINQYKLPEITSMADRVRVNSLGLSIAALGQGIPFFHAGAELLRSKSLERDSYNSGDWFNKLDFSYQSNNWGVGQPFAAQSANDKPSIVHLLTALDAPTAQDILATKAAFIELLKIRKSSPLFRLQTAADVKKRLKFYNHGPEQTPGVIVMALHDADNIDPTYTQIVVVFNATTGPVSIAEPELADRSYALHPLQLASADPVVQSAGFSAGTFTVPARTTAVFVSTDGAQDGVTDNSGGSDGGDGNGGSDGGGDSGGSDGGGNGGGGGSEPGVPPLAVDLYLRGTMNAWAATDKFTYAGNNVYKVSIALDAKTYTFKIADDKWTSDTNFGVSVQGDAVTIDTAKTLLSDKDSLDITVTTTAAGTYSFALDATDPKAPTLTIKAETTGGGGNSGGNGSNGAAPFAEDLFLRGNMNTWGATDKLTYVGNNAYEITLTLTAKSYEFKVADAAWAATTTFGGGASPAVSLGSGITLTHGSGSVNLLLTAAAAGDYKFRLDFTNPDAAVLTVSTDAVGGGTDNGSGNGGGTAPFAVDLYVRGTMNNWDSANKLEYVGNGIYQATITLAAKSYDMKIADANWKDVNLGGATSGESAMLDVAKTLSSGAATKNVSFGVASEGSYLFKLDANDKSAPTLTITAAN